MLKRFLINNLRKLKNLDFKNQYDQLNTLISPEYLLKFQKLNLTSIIRHSYDNVPYYRQIFDDIGLVENNIVNISKFKDIPILTKDSIRTHWDELISRDYTTRKSFYNSSGGSTGEPLKFIQDDNYLKWRNATNYYYYYNFLNVNEYSVKKIILWGSEKDLFSGGLGPRATMTNWLTNTVFLNSFKMSENQMNKYINIINSFEPVLIRGYAGSLFELAKYAKRKNIKMYKPRLLISAAEMLRDEMILEIESVFGTKVYNFYGSREVSGLAGECNKGQMHTFNFWNYLELLNKDNSPVNGGEEGKVIVTNLFNYSMPLIRYEIGDVAILGTKRCACGSPLPTIEKITGRITDHFHLVNGTTVPAEFFIHLIGVVCNKGFIMKFQVIQEDYNKIRILVVPEKKLDEADIMEIEYKIKFVMGEDCNISWEWVDDIQKTAGGKYIYTKSLIIPKYK